MSAILPGALIDVDAEPDQRFKVDRHEPWFSIGIENAPRFSNVSTLDPHNVGPDSSFTTFSTERAVECSEWFFDEDYQSLYELFQWV